AIQNHAGSATKRVAVHIQGAQRGSQVAAHRADTARVEILEHRVGFAIQATAVVEFAIQGQRDPACDRTEVLVLVNSTIIPESTYRRYLKIETLELAAIRRQGAVAAVTCPGNREREAGGICFGAVAELLDIFLVQQR